MSDTNKVEFGVSDIYVGTYTELSGVVTLGTPFHQPGAKTISLDVEGDNSDAYFDNIKYFSQYIDNGFSGSMEVARFLDDFKKQFLAYAETADGGIGAVKGATKPAVYIAFQSKGDAQNSRAIMYNVSLAGIKREYNTVEDKIDVDSESIDITVSGDNATGLTLVGYHPGDTGYDTLFTEPPVPALKTAAA